MRSFREFIESPRRLIVPVGLFVALTVSHVAHAGARPTTPSPAPAASQGVVNINTATEAQYAMLPGVGPKLASALNDYAEAHGDHKEGAHAAFQQVDDLLKVKGIGKGKLAKMRPYVVVVGATTAKGKIRGVK